MGVLLSTVGSFYVFGGTFDLACVYQSDSLCVRKHRFSELIVDLQRSIIMSLGNCSSFGQKGVYFPEKGVDFVEIPIVDIGWVG